jgi:hypothetical protein
MDKVNQANTACAEQQNAWLKKFSSGFRYMNRSHFNFLLSHILEVKQAALNNVTR